MPLASSQPRTITLSLPVQSAAIARVRRALVEAGLDRDLDHTVSLLATEVFTNSVRHAAGTVPIEFSASLSDGWVRIDVTDSGPGFDPAVRHQAAGFGLRLLDKLATRWGVERDGASTRVWFEVDRRRRRFDRAATDPAAAA